jgi:hypothetical protein
METALACLCFGIGEALVGLFILATGGFAAFKGWRARRRCKHSHQKAA